MLFGTDLEWNGTKASDFNLILAAIDNVSIGKKDSGRRRKIETIQIGDTPAQRIISNKYNGVLEDEFELFSKEGNFITESEYREIEKWLTIVKYTPLYIYRDKIKSFCYLNAVSTDIQPITDGENICGIYCSIQADAPYWWEDFEITYTVNGSSTVMINNTSDDMESPVYPIIQYIAASAGDISISNDEADVEWSVSSVQKDEQISFDNETLVFTSNINNRNFYPLFNRKIFKLFPGENTLAITADGSVTISGRIARKAGV